MSACGALAGLEAKLAASDAGDSQQSAAKQNQRSRLGSRSLSASAYRNVIQEPIRRIVAEGERQRGFRAGSRLSQQKLLPTKSDAKVGERKLCCSELY